MKSGRFKVALLIDDNHIDNIINKKILENNAFVDQIMVYQSAKEALEFLKIHSSDPELFPDFILLDIRMPEMDGFGFLEEFEKLESGLKVNTHIYILSSSLDPSDQRKVAENKLVSKFICKPLTSPHLQSIQSPISHQNKPHS